MELTLGPAEPCTLDRVRLGNTTYLLDGKRIIHLKVLTMHDDQPYDDAITQCLGELRDRTEEWDAQNPRLPEVVNILARCMMYTEDVTCPLKQLYGRHVWLCAYARYMGWSPLKMCEES